MSFVPTTITTDSSGPSSCGRSMPVSGASSTVDVSAEAQAAITTLARRGLRTVRMGWLDRRSKPWSRLRLEFHRRIVPRAGPARIQARLILGAGRRSLYTPDDEALRHHLRRRD